MTVPGSSTPPLFDRVLYDWSGSNWTGSHHQKATVVKAGTNLVAFVGGMDYVPNHRDQAPHNEKKWPDKSPWGWHDIGVRLRGEAAKGVWGNFRQRWSETITLPEKHWKKSPGDETETPKLFNPQPFRAPPGTAPTPTPAGTSAQSVQILRSRHRYKIPNRILWGGVEWSQPEPGGLYEVWNVLRKAIAAAERYIYIEDQFLADSLHPGDYIPDEFSLYPAIGDALAAQPDLKVIFVGSGKSDPDDPVRELKNRQLTSSIVDHVQKRVPLKMLHVAVWRVEDVTVHSKMVLIDDEFAAIGSANFQTRSMYGVDSELQAAIVAENDFVKQLRYDLWAEHWRLKSFSDTPGSNGVIESPAVEQSLKDVSQALGLWRPGWFAGDPNIWRTTNNPPGYTYPRGPDPDPAKGRPTKWGALAPVGPLPLE